MITLESQLENSLDKCPLCQRPIKVLRDQDGNFTANCNKCRLSCGPWSSIRILREKWNHTTDEPIECIMKTIFNYTALWEAMKCEKDLQERREHHAAENKTVGN